MDQELDDLLDSALGDFEKKLTISEELTPTKETTTAKNNVTVEKMNLYVDDDLDYDDRPKVSSTMPPPTSKAMKNESVDPNFGFNLGDENLKLFEGIFKDESNKDMKDLKNMFEVFQNSKDEASLLDNFQKVMSELINEEDNLDEGLDDFNNIEELDFFKKLSSAAKQAENASDKPADAPPKDESQEKENEPKAEKTPMQKVLDDMNKNSEKVLKNSAGSGFPFGADFLSSLSQGLDNENTAEGDGLDSATSMMMQPILSMLFSKEILYPSLKLMLENYDKYIEEKKDKLTEEEIKKCHEQKDYIKEMCTVYENSSETDSKEAKAEQLKNILDLLEKCGMPPSELVPEVNPFEGLGDKVNGCPVS